MWDSRQVGGNVLVHLIRTHPKIWLRGKVVENPMYRKPAEVLEELGRGSAAQAA